MFVTLPAKFRENAFNDSRLVLNADGQRDTTELRGAFQDVLNLLNVAAAFYIYIYIYIWESLGVDLDRIQTNLPDEFFYFLQCLQVVYRLEIQHMGTGG